MKSKLDFTKDKLRAIVLELSHNNGYEKPSTYLDELLKAVKVFKDINFECTFYLNIHCLCKENASAFRVPMHRDDITKWLCKSPIGKNIFPKTWDGTPLPMRFQSKPTETSISLQKLENNSEKLKVEVSKYGFFDLPKVKILSNEGQEKLIESLNKNGLPYSIAMFDFLGFINHLLEKHFTTKYKLNRKVSEWFDSDKEGRAVKGNISALYKNRPNNKNRYTAHLHKQKVQIDYQNLK